MPKPKIFISHSSPTPAADRRLRTIVDALSKSFAPWIDQRNVKIGKQWYQQIEKQMKACDAAVLLFDAASLKSDYVRHEVSVLSNRAHTENSFSFFVVMLDEKIVSDGIGKGSLRAARLGDMQMWRPTAKQMASDILLAEALAEEIEAEIGRGDLERFDPRRQRLVLGLKECFDAISDDAFDNALDTTMRQTRHSFGDMWKLMADNSGALQPDIRGERRRWLLAAWFVNQAEAGLEPIIQFFKPLYGAIQNSRRQKELLRLVFGAEAYWLGVSDGSCPITALTAADDRGGLVAINGRYVPKYTLEAFAHRALAPENFVLIVCDDGVLSKEQVIESIMSRFRTLDPLVELDIVSHTTRVGAPTICVLPRRFVSGPNDNAELEELRATFRSIVFVLWPGEALEGAAIPDSVRRIDPEVDINVEHRRYADAFALKAVVRMPA